MALARAADLNPARLYPLLVRLRRLNQVSSRWDDEDASLPGRRGRQLHRATDYGRWVCAGNGPRFIPWWPSDRKSPE